MSATKKTLVTLGVLLVVAVLVGAFVVYPAAAANEAHRQIEDALAALQKDGGMKLSDVTIDANGSNAISGLTGGSKVDSVTLRIGKIELKEDAAGGDVSTLSSTDQQAVQQGAEDVFGAIEDVGSFKLVLGEIATPTESLSLKDSSFTISTERYLIDVNVDKAKVDKLAKEAGFTADITAHGHDVSGTVTNEVFGEKQTEKFKLSIAPARGGTAVRYTYNGKSGTQPLDLAKGTTLDTIDLSTDGGVYSITLGGKYDYAAIKSELRKSLAAPTGATSVPPTP